MDNMHYLKTWPAYYWAVARDTKNFEVRKNDRDFQAGDIVELMEYNPETKELTGETLRKEISYVLHGGQFGIEAGYVVLGLRHTKQ